MIDETTPLERRPWVPTAGEAGARVFEPARLSVALGLGALLAWLPIFGAHQGVSRALGRLLSLPSTLLGLAARSTHPLVAPLLVLAGIQAGAWLRTGTLHRLAGDSAPVTAQGVLLDLAVGAVGLGGVAGIGTALLSFALLRRRSGDDGFDRLAARAGERYDGGTMTGWQFANAKLRTDPVYRDALRSPLLQAGGTLLDIGCSQGLMLAVLAEARRAARSAGTALPRFDSLIGVELRPDVARQAWQALGDEATILEGDATAITLPAADVVLVFDVLHLLTADQQRTFLAALFVALRPGGALLVRDAQRGGGLGFAVVRAVNWLKAAMAGAPRQSFHFRSPEEWHELFTTAGLQLAESRVHGPLGNALFELRRP